MGLGLPAGLRRCGISSNRDLFRSFCCTATCSIPSLLPDRPGSRGMLSLSAFLDEVMFEKYDVILHYDRGKGIRATRGGGGLGGVAEAGARGPGFQHRASCASPARPWS